jgi:hypothetical protein
MILRLWGIDTTMPLAGRHSSHDQFARAGARRIYTRNGVRVSISHHGAWAGENSDSMPRKGD